MPGKRVEPHNPTRTLKVRMYCHGFGDCFLITIPGSDRKEHYILIDCGVLRGTTEPKTIMEAVAQDILATTRGTLDVLAVTHDHVDHNSGFTQAAEIFEQIKFKELWLAWTEDFEDSLANDLRAGRMEKLKVVQMSMAAMGGAGSPLAAYLDFYDGTLAADGTKAVMTAPMRKLRDRAEQLDITPGFLEPGTGPITIPGCPAVKIYVLGPPRDRRLLESSITKSSDVYRMACAFSSGVASGSGSPFDTKFCLKREKPDSALDQGRLAKFYERNINPEGHDNSKREPEVISWDLAESLALRLDDDTNNTSLVLALETEHGEVLLFPGDAQIGNWRSWNDVRWKKKPGMTAAELLSRTVLYKVAHHGSQNATLRQQGLELMEDASLTVMLPVDEEVAKKQGKNGWNNIPFPSLLEDLKTKTGGGCRLLRTDDAVRQWKTQWKAANKAKVTSSSIEVPGYPGRPLWLQYELAL